MRCSGRALARPRRAIQWGLGIALLLSLGLLLVLPIAAHAGSTSASHSPPKTAQELAQRLSDAINAHDGKTVDSLVYWGTADASSRWLTEAMLKAFEVETIVGSKVTKLDPDPDPHYADPNGHTYGASIKPLNKLILYYKHGPDVLEDDGSLEIGEKDGVWYLVALARLK